MYRSRISKYNKKENQSASQPRKCNTLLLTTIEKLTRAFSKEEFETAKNLIDQVSSISLRTHLTRKNKVFMLCMIKPLTKNGIKTLSELIQAYEYESDEKLTKTMKIIISNLPETLVNISKCYTEDINSDNEDLKYMLIAPRTRKNVNSITVK
jgi:hypothetical protein